MISFRFQFLSAVALIAIALWIAPASVPARTAAKVAPVLPAGSYVFEGIAYDRLSLAVTRSRAGHAATRVSSDRRTPLAAGAPYRLTDLGVETGIYGYPLAVDNAGDIAYFYTGDYNYLLGDADIVHDDGTYTFLGGPAVDPYGDAGAIPYALNNTGDVAGVAITENDCCVRKHAHADWTPNHVYFGYSFDGSFAYALNDSNISVGQAVFSGVPAAAVFSISPQGGDRHPVMLLPPKNTSWVGTATGINDAGEIVGYAKNRAVLFKSNANAQVLPVGPAGVSTSAQAINAHGDIVGNAGSSAFLYRNRAVTYLPRPVGETAGNAVALAINASDEIVGDIVDPTTGTMTAFLYIDGQSYDLNSLLPPKSGYVITKATGINDSGEIVGEATMGSVNSETGVSLKPQSTLLRSTGSAPERVIRF